MSQKKNKTAPGTIAKNRSAHFHYALSDKIEAGLKLEGWEVKSLRKGKANIVGAHVFIKNGEAFVSGMIIEPLAQHCSYIPAEPTRIRKLLLKTREIAHLAGAVDRDGYTLVPNAVYWKKGWAKLSFSLGKGKKDRDKRQDDKSREWQRQQARVMKNG